MKRLLKFIDFLLFRDCWRVVCTPPPYSNHGHTTGWISCGLAHELAQNWPDVERIEYQHQPRKRKKKIPEVNL